MTMEDAVKHLENMKWLLGVNNTTVDDIPLTKVIDDIAALLKAQEPRVMTLDEVRKWEQPDVWMEFRKDGTIEPIARLGFAVIAATVTNSTVKPPVTMADGYGITWRCWTSRPADEQREATPWMT